MIGICATLKVPKVSKSEAGALGIPQDDRMQSKHPYKKPTIVDQEKVIRGPCICTRYSRETR